MTTHQDPSNARALHPLALEEWTARLLERIGTPPDIAMDVAAVLVAADRRDIASHGTARLPQYVRLVETGVLDARARPVIERERAAIGRFDACNGWGHHASRVAVDRATERAADTGTYLAVLRRSNHYGIAGWYALRAAERGFIGVSLTNTSPLVAPTRSRIPMLGTNPIAIAAPAGHFGTFCLDMATSTVPRGRIEVAARRGQAIPAGWALDPDSLPASTPEAALAGSLAPLGGAEETGGYKGYGLALAVDMLTGVLAGAGFGPDVPSLFDDYQGEANLGHAFLVIDPAAIEEPGAFEVRLEGYLDRLIAAPTIPDAPGRVLIAGEPEADAERRAARRGVVIDREHHEVLLGLAEQFGLPLPEAAAPEMLVS
jgi:LDH2 family malate/lactate/ureidoglycolate dehydrogenase